MPENRSEIVPLGAANLMGDQELLAAVVRLAGVGNVQAVVQSLQNHYPDMERLAVASAAELAALPDVSGDVAHTLTLVLEAGGRAQSRLAIRHGKVLSAGELGATMIRRFAGRSHEEMLVLFLDVKNQIIKDEVVSIGGIESSLIDQRVLMREALLLGSAQIVMVHNHPSGDPAPSPADIEVTQCVLEAGNLVGIALVDHLVIGSVDYVSFREHGYI